MKALSVVADLLVLNLITLVCFLPVLTGGTALTALNDLLIHMVRREETYLLRPYFRSFAVNWRKGTLLWLLLLLVAVLLYFDFLAATAYAPLLRVPIAAIGVLVFAVVQYAFALLSRYENTLFGTLKNAVTLAIAFFPRTLGMVVFTAAFWLLCVKFLQIGIPLLLLFGLSLPCYINALLLNGVFEKLDHKSEDT